MLGFKPEYLTRIRIGTVRLPSCAPRLMEVTRHCEGTDYVRADIADAMLEALELTIEWSPDIPTDAILDAIAKAKGEGE